MIYKTYLALKNDLRGFFSFGEMGRLKESEVLLWCHDINRNHLYKGLRFSTLTDSLNDKFSDMGFSTLTIARPYSEISEQMCYGMVRRVNGIIARAIILDYCFRLIKKCVRVLPSSCDVNFQVNAWEKILKKINPKFVIGIEPIKELCVAAKIHNIPTFDVQHGVQIDSVGEHSGHFYRMAYRGPTQKGWPDFVLCWDNESKELLKKHRGKYTKPLMLGHPWAIRFLSGNDRSDQLINEVYSKYELKSNLPVILYSLQYSRDANGNTDSFVRIPEELNRFIKNEGGAFTWWLRIHPQLLRDEFREDTFNKLDQLYSCYNNVNWHEVSHAPLPYILSKTCLHFTRDSSVTKEAGYFGIKSGLLDEPKMRQRLIDLYSHLIKRGDVEVINSYQQIKDFIYQKSNKPKNSEHNTMIDNYENMLRIIIQLADEITNERQI
ncbi:hypothetical protein OAN32_00335 [Amylibacter sp.]|nr:hypothetical protein [Amylibacter sp.]